MHAPAQFISPETADPAILSSEPERLDHVGKDWRWRWRRHRNEPGWVVGEQRHRPSPSKPPFLAPSFSTLLGDSPMAELPDIEALLLRHWAVAVLCPCDNRLLRVGAPHAYTILSLSISLINHFLIVTYRSQRGSST